MRIEILTLFPEMFAPLHGSILGRAGERGLVQIRETDIREFSRDKHKKCDDYPFGGGAGMVMMPQPVADAIRSVDGTHALHRVYLSPRGRTLDHSFIILDEAQNATQEQLKMFLTRIGEGSKAIVTGDITQIDLPPDKSSGLKKAKKILNGVAEISFIDLTEKDVVRCELVQKIIKAYEKYGTRRDQSVC